MDREETMSNSVHLGGVFTPAGSSLSLKRFGYGAIKLTGDMAFGPPHDRDEAVAVVREAVRIGINHIDTSDYYGPHIANEIIRDALHPYPDDLVIVTKVGARRGADKSWLPALSKDELVGAVHDNLRNLRRDVLDVVNLRVGDALGPNEDAIAGPLSVLAELQAQGLIRHIGLSNVTPRQFDEAGAIAKIVCVQNLYNMALRQDDAFIDALSRQGIAYVPFFPLGGFRPLRSPHLDGAASSLGATPRQVALAWLLQRSPNLLVIAGTSSIEHLRENVKAASLKLPPEIVEQLDRVAPQEGPRRRR
jgi:pyridoxine 4-dehydrogenase